MFSVLISLRVMRDQEGQESERLTRAEVVLQLLRRVGGGKSEAGHK